MQKERTENVSEIPGRFELGVMDVNSTQLRAKDCAGVSLADLGESYLCFHRCLPLFRSVIDNIKWDLPVHSSDQPQLLNPAWLSQRSMLLHDYPLSPYL